MLFHNFAVPRSVFVCFSVLVGTSDSTLPSNNLHVMETDLPHVEENGQDYFVGERSCKEISRV